MSGHKTWVDGDALTGPDVTGYLMNQAVMQFATAAARDAALTSPVEGMVTYQSDTKTYTGYNGTAWRIITGLADQSSTTPDATWQAGNYGVSLAHTYTLKAPSGCEYLIDRGWLTGHTWMTVNENGPFANTMTVTMPITGGAWAYTNTGSIITPIGQLYSSRHGYADVMASSSATEGTVPAFGSAAALQIDDILSITWHYRVA